MFDDDTPDLGAGYDRAALGEDVDNSALADPSGEDVDATPLEEADTEVDED